MCHNQHRSGHMIIPCLLVTLCRPLKQQPSTDHLGPLLVPAGSDSFSSIGLPHSSSSSSRVWDLASLAAGQQQWLEAVERVWPGGTRAGSKQQQQKGEGHGSSAVAFSSTYLEEGGWTGQSVQPMRCAVLCYAVRHCVVLWFQISVAVLSHHGP